MIVLEEQTIEETIKKLYKGRFINKGEQIAITLKNKTLNLKATVLEFDSLKDEAVSMNLSYGILEEQSEVVCKVAPINKD